MNWTISCVLDLMKINIGHVLELTKLNSRLCSRFDENISCVLDLMKMNSWLCSRFAENEHQLYSRFDENEHCVWDLMKMNIGCVQDLMKMNSWQWTCLVDLHVVFDCIALHYYTSQACLTLAAFLSPHPVPSRSPAPVCTVWMATATPHAPLPPSTIERIASSSRWSSRRFGTTHASSSVGTPRSGPESSKSYSHSFIITCHWNAVSLLERGEQCCIKAIIIVSSGPASLGSLTSGVVLHLQGRYLHMFVCVCVCACVRACVRVCVHACVRACMHVLFLYG